MFEMVWKKMQIRRCRLSVRMDDDMMKSLIQSWIRESKQIFMSRLTTYVLSVLHRVLNTDHLQKSEANAVSVVFEHMLEANGHNSFVRK